MPIYAYRCQQCGHAKDVIQKFSDAPLTVCPACGADAFRKQLTAPAFQLKGGGWYVTDFRDSGKSKSAEAKGESKAGSDSAAAGGGSAASDSAASTSASSSSSDASGAKPATPGPSSASGSSV